MALMISRHSVSCCSVAVTITTLAEGNGVAVPVLPRVDVNSFATASALALSRLKVCVTIGISTVLVVTT